MPEVDPAAEVFLRNLVHASDIRFRGRCQAPANLGTEAEKVVAAVGIDLQHGSGKSKAGYDKIRFCGEQARRDGLQYFWVDTCCIDKANHT